MTYIFKFSAKVIEAIEKSRRRFIWGTSTSEKTKLSRVEWQKVIAPKKMGGLGISSIYFANLSLLIKWWWRLKVEDQDLWAIVINVIHGVTRNDSNSMVHHRHIGVWLNTVKAGMSIIPFNLNLDVLFSRMLGNGVHTIFWVERCVGSTSLICLFPYLYILESDKSCSIVDRWHHCPNNGVN